MGYSIYIAAPSVEAADKIEAFLNMHLHNVYNEVDTDTVRDNNLDYHDKDIQNKIGFNYRGLLAYERYYLVALLQVAINKFGGVFYYDYSPDNIEMHGVLNDTRFPVPSAACWVETVHTGDWDKLCDVVEAIVQVAGWDQ